MVTGKGGHLAQRIQPSRPIQMRSSALLMPTRAGSSQMRSLTVPIRPPSITTRSPRSKCWTTPSARSLICRWSGSGACCARNAARVVAGESMGEVTAQHLPEHCRLVDPPDVDGGPLVAVDDPLLEPWRDRLHHVVAPSQHLLADRAVPSL